jgi:hypothetical protein
MMENPIRDPKIIEQRSELPLSPRIAVHYQGNGVFRATWVEVFHGAVQLFDHHVDQGVVILHCTLEQPEHLQFG